MSLTITHIDGAETGGLERCTSTTGSVAVSTTVRPGTVGRYSYTIPASATNTYFDVDPYEYENTPTDPDDKYVGFWCDLSGADATVTFFEARTSSAVKFYMTVDTNAVLRLYDGGNNLLYTGNTGDLSDDIGYGGWHHIGLQFGDNSATGQYRLRLDGTEVATGNATAAVAAYWTICRWGALSGSMTSAMYFDSTWSSETTTTDGSDINSRYNGVMDVIAYIGGPNSVSVETNLDSGTLADTQEIPVNDSNEAVINQPAILTTRTLPDDIKVQTNLTGTVADIDDDPDSPDANWLDATGSSTLRVSFAGVGSTVQKLSDDASGQEFRVLMRKSDTGPSGSGTQHIAPDALLVQTNLTGAVTDIDDDPDSPDANWLDATGSSTCRVSFPTPTNPPATGAGLQEFKVLLRKSATGPTGGTQHIAPDTIAASTNLTGAVTDIDDDPDSPDANWLDATGSSTLRVTFPTPTNTPATGAGLQEFKVLLRKSATGPTGGGTEDVLPNSLTSMVRYVGSHTDIDDDPDSPDDTWVYSGTSPYDDPSMNINFTNPTNGSQIDTATNAQTIEIYTGKAADNSSTDVTTGGDPTFSLAVYDSGGLHETLATNVTVTGSSKRTYTWTASGISSADDVYLVLTTTTAGGGPNTRHVIIDAVRWLMAYSATETQPGYEVKLYENGSEVSAAGSATGNLTDAGGDTVVNFTWDATNLGTADGSLVECYVNQTSGSDRYIDVGAVEWESDWGSSETQPGYEVKLYENGSEVVAAGSATGNLTDAGGDTVVSFTWDATNLGTANGSLVECYVNQTSGSDRYIDVGAIEWESDWGPLTETQPGYEIKLYRNGTEISAAGSTTGNLTDAGGDTVAALTWDTGDLGGSGTGKVYDSFSDTTGTLLTAHTPNEHLGDSTYTQIITSGTRTDQDLEILSNQCHIVGTSTTLTAAGVIDIYDSDFYINAYSDNFNADPTGEGRGVAFRSDGTDTYLLDLLDVSSVPSVRLRKIVSGTPTTIETKTDSGGNWAFYPTADRPLYLKVIGVGSSIKVWVGTTDDYLSYVGEFTDSSLSGTQHGIQCRLDAGGSSWADALFIYPLGATIECYVNQTSGTDRYIDIGAVEWNAKTVDQANGKQVWIHTDENTYKGPGGYNNAGFLGATYAPFISHIGMCYYFRYYRSGTGTDPSLQAVLNNGSPFDGSAGTVADMTRTTLAPPTVTISNVFDNQVGVTTTHDNSERGLIGFAVGATMNYNVHMAEMVCTSLVRLNWHPSNHAYFKRQKRNAMRTLINL